MNSKRLLVLSVVVALQSGSLLAAFPGTISRDSLVSVENLSRLSVGVDYTVIKRDITVDLTGGGELEDTLEARSIDGVVAVDVTPWLSPFVTLGSSAVLDKGTSDYGDYKFKWSAGLNFNIWHYDIVNPDFLAGRLSIESMVEYSRYTSQNIGPEKQEVEWSDTTVVIPIGYEMFEDLSPLEDKSLRKSLNLYVGPAMSVMDGTLKSGGSDVDFKDNQRFGFIGGVDIFLADQLSIGGQVLVFDEVGMTGAIRYHF
jgi:hypothetical protein